MNILRRATSISSSLRYFNSSVAQGPVSSNKHYERRLLKFSAEQFYDVVADVNQYQNFVPWCKGSKVIRKDADKIEAELVVGFGYFNEKYLSVVTLDCPRSVTAISKETNLLEYLRTEWKFTPSKSDPSKCWVSFQIDFKFRSALYNQVSDMFLQDIVKNMVQAFEAQCRKRFYDSSRR